MFEAMPGLRLKVFTFDEKQQRAANFYVWDSWEAAESFFTEELRERVTGLYGVAPSIEFVEIAEIVDNSHYAIAGRIGPGPRPGFGDPGRDRVGGQAV